MEKTMIPLTEVYKIADKMARPWHWAATALSIALAGLVLCIILHHCQQGYIIMLKEARNFVESLLEEANATTIKNAIRVFNLPILLERTLTEIYIDGLEIKQIAGKHNVDERTVKRWKKAAIDTAEIHFKNYMLCHFNVTSEPLTDTPKI